MFMCLELFAIHNMHSQLLREGWQLGAEDEERQTRQPYFPTLDEIVSIDLVRSAFLWAPDFVNYIYCPFYLIAVWYRVVCLLG